MCGIYGWFDGTIQFQKLFNSSDRKAVARLQHRGPDDFGNKKSSNFYVEHHRLKIVGGDDDGRQPYFNQERNSGLVFNGEIYNFKELREELKESYTFKTDSDGEVLFVGLEQQGEIFLGRIQGIFAGFYWSEEKNVAFLFRDQFGVKPLYYTFDGAKTKFCSEIRPLLKPGERTKINEQAFYEHLRLRYSLGNHTIFDSIQRVGPGEIFDLRLRERRHFSFPQSKSVISLTADFKEAVEKEIPNFPFYSLLSGGVDSSAIASILQEKTELARFMTVQGPEFEEKDARLSLKDPSLLDTCLTEDISENSLKAMVESLEEPIGDSIGLIQMRLFAEISKQTRVAMSGEGADEIFFGYVHYWILFLMEKIDWLPIRKFLRLLSAVLPIAQRFFPYEINLSRSHLRQIFRPWLERKSFSEQAAHMMSLFSEEEATELLGSGHLSIEEKMKGISSLNDLRQFDLKNWLPSYNLLRLDRLAMNYSLELRVPYLHQSFASSALRFSAQDNITWFQRKKILREALKGIVANPVRKRQKKAFTINALNSERLGLRTVCLDILERRGRIFFNPVALKKILLDTDHYFYDKRLFNLTLLTLWCERFKE